MKDFITKMTCVFLLLTIGAWGAIAQHQTTILPDGRAVISNTLVAGVGLGGDYIPEKPKLATSVKSEPLWDNTFSTITNSIISSYWSADGGYTLCADDFIAEEAWVIEEIIISGSISATSMQTSSMGITIYSDNNGEPGDELFTDKELIPVSLGGDVMSLTLSSPWKLPAGNYWISAYGVFPVTTPTNATVGTARWNWSCGGDTFEEKPYITDPWNIFSMGPGWTTFAAAGLSAYNSLYFSLSGSLDQGEQMYDHYAPPTDVTATANGNNVIVKWKAPIGFTDPGYEGMITHAGNDLADAFHFNAIPGYYGIFSRWTIDDLDELGMVSGNTLTEVHYKPWSISGITCKLQVYQGGSSAENPGTMVVDQEITQTITEQAWNTITLDTPLSIDPTKELWFGIQFYQTSPGVYPASFDGGPAKPQKNPTLWPDGSWTDITDVGFDGNYMLRGMIMGANGKAAILNNNPSSKAQTFYYIDEYEIYCNDHLVGKTSGTSFTHQYGMVAGGELDYCVRSVFNDGGKSEFACAETLDAGAGTITINPGCLTSIKFTEDFETTSPTVGQWVNQSTTGTAAWAVYAFNGGTSLQPQTTPSGAVGRKAAIRVGSFTANVAKFISPPLNLEGDNAMMSFWHTQRPWGSDQDELRVYYAHSATGPWTQIAAYTSAFTDWTEETITLPNPSSTYYIAFEGTVKYGYGVQIDDVAVYGGEPDLPAPDAPVNLTAAFDGLNWYNVNLNWEMHSTVGITGYYLYRGGIMLNYGAPVEKNAMKYLDVVPGAGTYLYEVQSISTDGCLSEKTPLTVVVEPDPCDGLKVTVYPYTQGFEDSQNLLELCWKQEIMKGHTAWEIVPASTGEPATAHGGAQKIRYYYDYQLEQVARLISPMFDLSEGGGVLSFWYTNKQWYLGQDVLRIYYKNKANSDWILLETFSENVENWTLVTINLPENTATYWLCLEGNTNQGYGLQLDDIKVTGCALQKELPWIEGFENGADVLNCWVQEPDNPSYLWSVVPASTSSPTTAHSGAYKLRYNTSTFSGYKNFISSPNFNFTRENYDFLKFTFWHTQQVWTPDQDELRFYYKTDPEAEWTQLGEWTNNISTWTQESFVFTDVASTFRFAFEGTANYGYGVQIDDIGIYPCQNIEVPFEETFDTEVPVCWDNLSLNNATPWKFVTTGVYPTCSPHSAGGMLQFNSFSSPYTSGTKAQLYTAPVKVPITEKYVEISFWMYRDASYSSYTNERVNLYVSPTTSIEELSPILSIPRAMALAPAETAAGWYQYTTIIDVDNLASRRFRIVLEAVSQYGNNIYVDDLSANYYYCEDNIATLPLISSFENEFPDVCWDLAASSGTVKWAQVETDYGTSPQDGAYQIMSDCWSASPGDHSELTTREFYTDGRNQAMSFWIYRNGDMVGYDDWVHIYLTEDGNVEGVEPIFSVSRQIATPPVVPKAGWYQYYVGIPCADMVTARVSIQAVGGWGSWIYVDNFELGDLCVPPQNVVSLGAGEIPYFWTEGHITWEAPAAVTESLSGYEVYRDGALLATVGSDVYEYIDDISNLPAGEYFYCVVATYDNDCGESESICGPDPIVKVTPCENAPMPHSLSAEKHVDEWYDVDLRWANPLGGAMSQVASDPAIAFGYWGDPIFMAVKFKPVDLAPYTGSKISKITVALYEPETEYTLKLYKGGSELEPGTVIHTQNFNSSTYINATGYAWADIVLSSQITLDGSDYLWVELGSSNYPNYPAVFDSGPTTEEEFSDLLKLGNDGEWASIASQGYAINACIQVFIRTIEGNDEIIGFNVYRDDVLLTNPMLSGSITKYRDRVPGPGSYLYEVSAIYHTHCITDRAALTVEMPQSPCEVLWTLPIIEYFDDFSRFPPWCWELGDDEYPWQHVTSGSPPRVNAYSGEGMLMYANYNYPANVSGLIFSPKFATADNDYTLKFMMYRDNDGYYGSSSWPDRVEIYVNDEPNINGLSPVYTVYRNISLSPAVTEEGWHQFSTQIPTSGMNSGAYVIFRGVGEWGNNSYIDDIMIVDEVACDPVWDVIVEQPHEGEVLISWNAPLNSGLTGYRVFRDGVLIANNLTETFITDYVSLGAHEYCITALFNKPECSESVPMCITIDVFAQCDAVKSVTAEVVGDNSVQVAWVPTAASGVTSYTLYRNGSILIPNHHDTHYLDTDLAAGAYTYGVTVNYASKPCQMSDVVNSNEARVEYCAQIINLDAVVSSESVTLTWDFVGEGFDDIILYEAFENDIPGDWLNKDMDGDGYTWYTEKKGVTGDFAKSMTMLDIGGGWYQWIYPDEWLITNPITLRGEETLEFYLKAGGMFGYAEKYALYISTTGTEISDFTMIGSPIVLDASYGSWKKVEVDLTGHVGRSYLAFRHYESEGQDYFGLDDVKVIGVWGVPTFDIYKDGVFMANVEAPTWIDTDIEPGKEYQYCIRPVFENCTVEPVCVPVYIDECVLGDVSNVIAVQQEPERPKRIDLSWSYSGEPAEFEIQRSEDGIHFIDLETVSDMAYSDETVEYDKSYTYCVKAVKADCVAGEASCGNAVVRRPVGIDDLESALNIYPNPASTTVAIEGGAIVEVEVYNAVGQLIDRIMAIEGETVKHINVAGYEAGAYIFRLFSADQKTINKPIMVAR